MTTQTTKSPEAALLLKASGHSLEAQHGNAPSPGDTGSLLNTANKAGTEASASGFKAPSATSSQTTAPYLKEYDGPPIVELPEFPPPGQTVYIPHVWRDGSKAPTEMFSHTYAPPGKSDDMGCAFTIKRTGNVDTFIPCGCRLCYERWSYRRKRA
jgi:hypothetical protein